MENWEVKLKTYFDNTIVDKSLMKSFDTYKLPRYVSEYLVSQFIDEHGISEGLEKLEEFLSTYYPKSNSSDLIHYKIQQDGFINVIDNFKVKVHIEKTGDDHTLVIPSLNIKNAKIVNHDIIKDNPRLLGSGLWGMGKIIKYSPTYEEDEEDRRVTLTKFKPFQVSSIDLKYFKSLRENFSTEEWIDVLISSMGFNPLTFSEIKKKLILLSRLLPLVQKSIFLYEFGRPGTGKTYVFDKLSNNSFVVSGSKITPAKLFKDCGTRQEGLLRQYDALLFDEIDKVNNTDFQDEIVNKLLKFMESNTFDRCGEELNSTTSIIFSGNLNSRFNYNDNNVPDFLSPLIQKLKGEAFLDRFSGVIPGWEIAPLSSNDFSNNLGFSADYFSEIIKELREEDWEGKVSQLINFSDNTTTRDEKAVIKTIAGLVKLIFPDYKIDNEYLDEIIKLAAEYRQLILNQRYKLYKNSDDSRTLNINRA